MVSLLRHYRSVSKESCVTRYVTPACEVNVTRSDSCAH